MFVDVSLFPELQPRVKAVRRIAADELLDLNVNAMSADAVATLTRPEREARVSSLVEESHRILEAAVDRFIVQDGKELAGVVGLFSGGNDSTTLCHLMLNEITHLAHANTTIGIEETRCFVREVADQWGKPLLEFVPPRESDHYRSLVLAYGFPGPGHHYKMYQRLKERALNRVRKQLVTDRSKRIVYLAGRRRTESSRRSMVPAIERESSIIWVSPMVNWTKMDLNTYRLLTGNVPVNPVADLIHMSGECLCGSFAHPGELQEIAEWFPAVVADIRRLEEEVKALDHIPPERKKWGWGANRQVGEEVEESGPLCSSCDWRYQQYTIDDVL